MADVFRLVRYPNGDRTRKQTVVLDLADGVNYYPTRDTLQLTPPGKSPILGAASRRYGGERQAGEIHQNASVYREIVMKSATSADDALNAAERIVIQTEQFDGLYLEWRPDGASRSVFFEVRGTATWSTKYSWLQFAQARSWTALLNFPVATLALGDLMDFTEDWAQDSMGAGDYTFDALTAASVTVSGGQLQPNGSLGVERRFVHTGRGYLFPDHHEGRQFQVGSTISGLKVGVLLKRLDASNYIECHVTDNGTNSVLNIDVVAGGRTNRATATLSSRLATSGVYWIVGRIEGSVVYAKALTGQAAPSPYDTAGNALATASYALSSSEATQFGGGVAGRGGTSWNPPDAAARLLTGNTRPYTFWSTVSAPEDFPLFAVPGSAPAAVDLTVASNGAAASPVSALLAWANRTQPYNRVWNGDFERNAAGWAATAAGGSWPQVAATSVARVTASAKYGVASLAITTPATLNSGANFAIYRRFKRGVTYTLTAWLTSNNGVALAARLGNQSGSDMGAAAAVAPSANSYMQVTATWTPSADADIAILAVYQTAATASTINVDSVVVYDGTAPAGNQSQGAGAVPPYGIVKAESHDQSDISGWTLQADATYLGGYGIKAATSGAGSGYATWFLDPSLVPADAFVKGELHVEVWARVEVAASLVSPRLTLSALSEAGTSYGSERFSNEWGALGKQVNVPASGSALARPVKLGTIRLPTTNNGLRWKLKVTGNWSAGSSGNLGIDYLVLAPARQRAVSPSSKTNDTNYPRFLNTTSEAVKTITTDLRGRQQKVPLPMGDDTGLGGSRIEMGGFPAVGQSAVDVQAIMALWPLVPDDPTSDNSTMGATLPATFHAAVTPRYNLVRGA